MKWDALDLVAMNKQIAILNKFKYELFFHSVKTKIIEIGLDIQVVQKFLQKLTLNWFKLLRK